jgi:hypothetical protein
MTETILTCVGALTVGAAVGGGLLYAYFRFARWVVRRGIYS